MLLPTFQSNNQPFQLMQNKWASILNPIISNPVLQCSLLENVALTTGSNTINHRLGKDLTGWYIVRQRSAAAVYDDQDNNQQQDLTLVLVSDANVSVDLVVF